MNNKDIKVVVVVIFTFFFVVLGITGLVQFGRLLVNPEVEVLVDKRLVYKGTSACVGIRSAGFNTQVKIHKKSLCFIPDKIYVSRDVVVNTVED